jgi:hypothetical protein
MTDDDHDTRLHEELRAIQAYFAHRAGREGEQPLSEVVAALMSHCVIGIEPIQWDSPVSTPPPTARRSHRTTRHDPSRRQPTLWNVTPATRSRQDSTCGTN